MSGFLPLLDRDWDANEHRAVATKDMSGTVLDVEIGMRKDGSRFVV